MVNYGVGVRSPLGGKDILRTVRSAESVGAAGKRAVYVRAVLAGKNPAGKGVARSGGIGYGKRLVVILCIRIVLQSILAAVGVDRYLAAVNRPNGVQIELRAAGFACAEIQQGCAERVIVTAAVRLGVPLRKRITGAVKRAAAERGRAYVVGERLAGGGFGGAVVIVVNYGVGVRSPLGGKDIRNVSGRAERVGSRIGSRAGQSTVFCA